MSAKGALSVFGLSRFPVTLYKEQWARLLGYTEDIRTFLDEHDSELKSKKEDKTVPAGPRCTTTLA